MTSPTLIRTTPAATPAPRNPAGHRPDGRRHGDHEPVDPAAGNTRSLADADAVQAALDAVTGVHTEPAVYFSALEHRHLGALLDRHLPGVVFTRTLRAAGLCCEVLFVDTAAPAVVHAPDCETTDGAACAPGCVDHGPVTAVRAVLTWDSSINHTVVAVASVGDRALWDRLVACGVMWEMAGRPVPALDAVPTIARAVENATGQNGGQRS
ncbi:hypothetical protein [Saccharothrix sp. HUAS TT1]|uniref:hypothetical protein n=1 Tax=unclassified Saccharothrix TaxID=2593673 RepID=UPI00345B5B4E